jgi:hypothetical protein
MAPGNSGAIISIEAHQEFQSSSIDPFPVFAMSSRKAPLAAGEI